MAKKTPTILSNERPRAAMTVSDEHSGPQDS